MGINGVIAELRENDVCRFIALTLDAKMQGCLSIKVSEERYLEIAFIGTVLAFGFVGFFGFGDFLINNFIETTNNT